MRKVGRLQCLVLTSGGMDSTACLAYYKSRRQAVRGLFVDYGQPAARMEARAAAAVCRKLAVPLGKVRVSDLSIPVGGIRGRNALLLIAALMKLENEAGLVALGIHGGTAYADCTPGFVAQMQGIYDAYCAGQVRIDAPFARWTKRDVYDFAVKRRVPLALTYSCLRGGKNACGKCESCRDVEALHAS